MPELKTTAELDATLEKIVHDAADRAAIVFGTDEHDSIDIERGNLRGVLRYALGQAKETLTRERDAARDALRKTPMELVCPNGHRLYGCVGDTCGRCALSMKPVGKEAAAALAAETDKPENAAYMNCTCGHYACEHHDVAGCGNAGCDCKQFVVAAETEEQ